MNITTGSIHHVYLTVTDVNRAIDFYSEILGFQKAGEFGDRVVLSNGSVAMGIGTAPGRPVSSSGDSFDENHVGLDHLSLSVASRDELERAERVFDTQGVPHGDIEDIPDFNVSVLMLRDPDNIQVELLAPLG